jgi:transposase-like protein
LRKLLKYDSVHSRGAKMKKKDFSALLVKVNALSTKQKTQLVAVLHASEASQPQPGKLVDEEFAAKPVCPACSSESLHKWGIVSGLQRYRCKECKRTFNALTGTSMARLRKKELWLEYSQALMDSLSLTKAAERCGIDRTTAFRWRHRFLPQSALQVAKCTGLSIGVEKWPTRKFGRGSP